METRQPDGVACRDYPLHFEHARALVCRKSCGKHAWLLSHSCILRRAGSWRNDLECNILAAVHYCRCKWWHLWLDRGMHFREYFLPRLI